MFILFFFLLFCCLQKAFSQCPVSCDCQTKTIICEVCLTLQYQTYDLTTKTCKCYKDFQKFHGGGDKCCPNNCEVCFNRGCATCKKYARVQTWNNTLKYFACTCDQNYYLEETDCLCLSNHFPTQYYLNLESQECKKCPIGCTCSSQGCIACSIETQRTISISLNNLMICECSVPFKQVHGSCQCPINCTCVGTQIVSCLPQSHLQVNIDTWFCSKPYSQINGICQCVEPYTLIQVYGKLQCLCKSKINFKSYYQSKGQCFKCNEQCTCSQKGVKSCINTRMEVVDFQIVCKNNYSLINGQCACISPFYLSSQGICSCLSFLYPQLYFLEYGHHCMLCPKDCICNQKGCISCKPQSLRLVWFDEYFNQIHCVCSNYSKQDKNKCICPKQYFYDPQTLSCVCLSQQSVTLATNWGGFCQLCPKLCLCDERGCYFCYSQAQRIIEQQYRFVDTFSDEQKLVFVCRCKQSFDVIDGYCRCGSEYKFLNQTNGYCQCAEPYYKYAQWGMFQFCDCKEYYDPVNYYLDYYEYQCHRCPNGCKCSLIGCYQCHYNSLRFVYYSQDSQKVRKKYFRCPCLQNTFQINSTCVLCPNSSYFNGDVCIECLTCKTCDFRGCLSCGQDMTLSQFTCICNNQDLTNIDGFCMCPLKYYQSINISNINSQKVECLKCPIHCLTCTLIDHSIICISCNTSNTFRNEQNLNCSCLPGYVESFNRKQYCCSSFCEDCNEQGCLSCPKYTHRTLINKSCLCLNPYVEMVENSQFVCKCPTNRYYNNESCLLCTPNCLECISSETNHQIICTKCQQRVNRNIQTLNCSCLSGYKENYPIKQYCTSIGCSHSELICSSCQFPRVLNSNHQCVCPEGYFPQSRNSQVCLKCFIEGCLICNEWKTCQKCNETDDLFLSSGLCLKLQTNSFIMSQTHNNKFVLQILLSQPIQFQELTSTLYTSRYSFAVEQSNKKLNSIQRQQHIPITVLEAKTVSPYILNLVMQNPTQKLDNAIVSLLFSNSQGEKEYQILNIFIQQLLQVHTLSSHHHDEITITFKVISIMFMIVSLVISTFGYKHNQPIFFMQTMFMLSLFLNKDKYETTKALFSLRYTIFYFQHSLANTIIPQNYLQSSPGNFKYFTIDSNLFRMTINIIVSQGITILLILFFMFLIKQCHEITKINSTFIQLKKKIFRFLELMFKINMYPIVFFSFQTLINSECQVYINKEFKTTSIVSSIFCLLLHVLFLLYLIYLGGLSKFNRLQLGFSFIFCYIFSFVLILSLKVNIFWIVVIIVLLLIHDIGYLVVHQSISEEVHSIKQVIFLSIFNYEIIGSLLQIIPLVLVYYNKGNIAIIMTLLIILIQLLIQVKIIYKSQQISTNEKIISKNEDPSRFSPSETMSHFNE